jgi:DNA-binding NtrC family response regulator
MAHTILLVDDEEMILKSLKRSLHKENFDIFTATNGDEAMRILEGREFNVVVSDNDMPGISGIDLLAKIKTASPETITIMLTGQSDIDVAMNAINDAGVYKFILKPWDPNDLIVTLRRACESYDLLKERNTLVEKVRRRDTILNQLEKEHPGITQVNRDEEGYIIAD